MEAGNLEQTDSAANCTQLFNWIISVTEVADRHEFGSFLVSSFPDWLPQMYELEAKSRNCEFTIDTANQYRKRKETYVKADDPSLTSALNPAVKEQEDVIEEQERIFADITKDVNELCDHQMKREDVAILNLEDRLLIMG